MVNVNVHQHKTISRRVRRRKIRRRNASVRKRVTLRKEPTGTRTTLNIVCCKATDLGTISSAASKNRELLPSAILFPFNINFFSQISLKETIVTRVCRKERSEITYRNNRQKQFVKITLKNSLRNGKELKELLHWIDQTGKLWLRYCNLVKRWRTQSEILCLYTTITRLPLEGVGQVWLPRVTFPHLTCDAQAKAENEIEINTPTSSPRLRMLRKLLFCQEHLHIIVYPRAFFGGGEGGGGGGVGILGHAKIERVFPQNTESQERSLINS